MFGQRLGGFPYTVQKEGCALLSLCYLAWDMGGLPDSAIAGWLPSEVMTAFEEMRRTGMVAEDCTIEDWDRCMKYLSHGRIEYYGYKSVSEGQEERVVWVEGGYGVIACYQVPTHPTHFVVADNYMIGAVKYDPWPASVSVREGEILSYRVFRPVRRA